MARSRFVTHAEAEQVMRRAGHSKEEIERALHGLPDPIDTERYAVELVKRGMTVTNLTDRMGGSP